MDEPRRPPVLGDAQDFEWRVRNNNRLNAIATMLEHELHEGRITLDDAVRLGVCAATRYLMHRAVPFVIKVDVNAPEPDVHGLGCRCRRCE